MTEQATARKKIFISHSRQDKDIAEKLCRELEKQGFGCWIFTRDIAPGEDFTEAIVDAINWEWMENPFTENKIRRACAARDLNVPRSFWDVGGFRVVCEFAPGEGKRGSMDFKIFLEKSLDFY